MSDIESYRSESEEARKILSDATRSDDVLNDHRNQLPSLPVRNPASAAITDSSAVSDSDSEEELPAQETEKSLPTAGSSRRPSGRTSQDQRRKTSRRATEVPATIVTDTSSPEGKPTNRSYMNTLRRDFYLKDEDEDDSHDAPVPILRSNTRRNRSRSQSYAEQDKKDESGNANPGILLNPGRRNLKVARKNSFNESNNLESDLVSPMTRIKTADSNVSDNHGVRRERRASRSSIDSEADSHASRTSQETEEDVCFPMLREHIRIKGIDFDEIEEFIRDEREQEEMMRQEKFIIAQKTASRVTSRDARSTGSISNVSRSSTAALKYTPKNILKKTNTALSKFKSRVFEEQGDSDSVKSLHGNEKEKLPSDSSSGNDEYELKNHSIRNDIYLPDDSSSDKVKFGGTRISDGDSSLPDRFSFFSSESEETIHAPDIPSLVEPGQTVRELFRNGEGTWWLDCVCPTDAEMKLLAKAFGIHPLTAEDIRMQETREKVELFRSYYFVCFHTFEPDKESEDYLEPINVYIVVFTDGILTFHFSPISHPASVRRRVRQLRDYVDVSADWLCYAMIDDITDGFAPVITGIEYEADAIEDSVFVARDLDFSNMLQRIGESRRKVMTLMRLLSGKADVIKMFAKRCQDEAAVQHVSVMPIVSGTGTPTGSTPSPYPVGFGQGGTGGVSFGPGPGAPASTINPTNQWQFNSMGGRAQPRADIALYLGDIQDHVVTMFQNLLAYEKIFSRSHSNYLAQLQVESFNSNNKVTEMLSKVTLLGTMLVPLNLVTGLFGMNVHVPGEAQEGDSYRWFFGIIGVMIAIIICSLIFAKWWLGRIDNTPPPPGMSSRRSIKSLGLRTRTKEAAKSILSFPNKYD